MSDDDDYEYGGYYDSEDDYNEDIADHVNSLAEHTSHSPVLVNAHPDFDVDFDEWEYLTDEYWDGETDAAAKTQDSVKPGKQDAIKNRRSHQEITGDDDKRKRRKAAPGAEQSFRHPVVVWKRQNEEDDPGLPILKSGDGDKITILRNWRELLDQPAFAEDVGSANDTMEDKVEVEEAVESKKTAATKSSQKKRARISDGVVKELAVEKDKNPPRKTRTSKRLRT